MSSFTSKQLRVTFIMTGVGQVFPGTGNNTLTLAPQDQFTGLRITSKVEAVARLATQLDLQVYGMKAADMDALTVAWANPPVVLNNKVILEANDGSGWVQVFAGTIKEAQPIYRAQPNVYFQVLGITGYLAKINPIPPTSYPYQVDIGVAAPDIIAQMGTEPNGTPTFTYVDGGADGVLTNPYFWGTAWDQLRQACIASKSDFYAQGNQVLITKHGLPRNSTPAVVLNKTSGLIGSPEYSGAGLEVIAIWNAAFLCGSALQIDVARPPAAAGRWFPIKLQHRLDAFMPRGQWSTNMQCLRVLV